MGLNKYEVTYRVVGHGSSVLWLTPSLHTYRLRSKPVDVFIEIYNMIATQLRIGVWFLRLYVQEFTMDGIKEMSGAPNL